MLLPMGDKLIHFSNEKGVTIGNQSKTSIEVMCGKESIASMEADVRVDLNSTLQSMFYF
jgi:hypothetical protein